MDLNLDALYSFIVFSETRNFTRAAETLHISQPALHVKIKKLSADLGVPLYRKNGRELILTNYGKELVRFGREAQNHVNGFIEELTQGKRTQPVILAAGAGSYMYLLGDAIRRFKSKSDVQLRLLTADRTATLELLNIGKAHLGVTALDSVPVDFDAHLLAKVPATLIVPNDHRLAKKQTISISELDDAALIVPEADKPHRSNIERVLETHNISWNVAIEASGWELMIHFVKLGLGTAIVNGCCTVPKGLKALPIREFPTTKYYLLNKRSINFSPSQERLSELIRNYVNYSH